MKDSVDDPATAAAARAAEWGTLGRRWADTVRYLRRNPSLGVGLALIVLLGALRWAGGSSSIRTSRGRWPRRPSRPPSWAYPFGTDMQGRNLLARHGLRHLPHVEDGADRRVPGRAIGAVLGFVARVLRRLGGYGHQSGGGRADHGARVAGPGGHRRRCDAQHDHGQMAVIVALLAWRQPARQIRGQVLVMRELGVRAGWPAFPVRAASRIIFREMMPNLIPYLMRQLRGGRPRPSWPAWGWRRWAWAPGRADAGHDHLLGDVQLRLHAGHVVVDR